MLNSPPDQQGIAAEFNKTAVRIVTIMQQPVPFVYFHLLKLMMVMVNVLVGIPPNS